MKPAMAYPGLEHSIAYMLHVEQLTADLTKITPGNKSRQARDYVAELKKQGKTHIEALSSAIYVFSS